MSREPDPPVDLGELRKMRLAAAAARIGVNHEVDRALMELQESRALLAKQKPIIDAALAYSKRRRPLLGHLRWLPPEEVALDAAIDTFLAAADAASKEQP